MNKVMIALALGAAAIGGVAMAQDDAGAPPHRGGGMGMMRADTNGDGVVTRAEYQAQIDSRFARLDANGDGKLDADEMPMRGMGGHGGRATAGDNPPPPSSANASPSAPVNAGTTRDQFRAVMMARFDRLDANHDGKLDAGELPRPRMRTDGAQAGRPAPQPTPMPSAN